MAMHVPLPSPFEETLTEAALSFDQAHETIARRLLELETLDLWECPFAVVDIETTGGVGDAEWLRHDRLEVAGNRV